MDHSRQVNFIGAEAQRKIENTTVLVVGCGGIGSVAAELLARMGFSLVLLDRDVVEKSNLHRQLYDQKDAGKPKAAVLERHLKSIGKKMKIDSIVADICDSCGAVKDADIILDCMDNMESRFVLNDASRKFGKPLVYSAAIQSEGVVFLANYGNDSPCIRCVFPSLPSAERTCERDGVLPTATAMAAVIACGMCTDFVTGKMEKNITYFKKSHTESIHIMRRKGCQCCSGNYEYMESAKHISKVCGGMQISVSADLKTAADAIGKNYEFIMNAKASNFISFDYKLQKKKASFMLFENRAICRNASEKEASSILSRLGCRILKAY